MAIMPHLLRKKMETIDVTLRESVYCNEFISLELGLEMIRKLSLAGIDYIEIGYLKKDCITKSLFLNYNREYINKAYSFSKGKAKLSAMIHPEDFYSNDWDLPTLKKLFLIRICINEKNINQMEPLVNFFHKIGLQVSLNLTHASRYNVNKCLIMAKIAIKNQADFFYLADSNGNFLPEDVASRIKTLTKNVGNKIKIGFHPHDNLSLVQINALEALENGAVIIDSSIQGFGKGSGNLRTEMFPLLFLRKNINYSAKYNISELFKIARHFNNKITKIKNFEEQYKYSLLGMKNFGLKEDKELSGLAKVNNIKDYDLVLLFINKYDCNLNKLIDGLKLKTIR